ncbi:MAG: hypothetical protein ACM35H_02890, partial [Bacteroidota bacterium]|nr:hypothetical protein [Kiloniellaceae bacterium]
MAEGAAEDGRGEGALQMAGAGGQPQRLACPSYVNRWHGSLPVEIEWERLLHRKVFRRSFRHFPVFSDRVRRRGRLAGKLGNRVAMDARKQVAAAIKDYLARERISR